jgi:hypothetical protein
MSNEMLEKVIRTTEIGDIGPGSGPSTGGLLRPAQADRFIDYMFDQTVLGGQVRTFRMRANEQEVDRIAVGERIVRKATEAVDDHVNVGVAFARVSLKTEKLRLDWELSTESLEDNLEGEALEDHIARLMSGQAANDLEDLAINGDTDLTNDWLLSAFDGWGKRLNAGGNVVDAAGAGVDRGLFARALRAMPRQFMQQRRGLKWFMNSTLISDYLYSTQLQSTEFITSESAAQAGLNQPVTTTGPAGYLFGGIYGIQGQEVPLLTEYDVDGAGAGGLGGDIWLVDPQNLLFGIKREITVWREYKPKKDTIEWTIMVRCGASVENPQAAVVIKNVAYTDLTA